MDPESAQIRETDVEPSPDSRVPFFGSGSPRGETTGIISLFVLINILAFLGTMCVNDCTRNSDQVCLMKFLGRFSVQPFSENPLLGPASSTLVKLGALDRDLIMGLRQRWRLLTSSWLHAGLVHLVLNLISIIFVGIRLEQAFGPLRVGVIYLLSSFFGSFFSAIFLQHSPSVGSSGALSGLLGAIVCDLIKNWKLYYERVPAILIILLVGTVNFVLGLLPFVDIYSYLGGFLSGLLLGFILLFNPQFGKQRKGLYEFHVKKSAVSKQKMDNPMQRITCLVVYCLIFGGTFIAVLHGVNGNKYCQMCHYFNCIPLKQWQC